MNEWVRENRWALFDMQVCVALKSTVVYNACYV